MIRKSCLVISVLGLVACQTPPQTQELMLQNQNLQSQLSDANTKISRLEADNRLQQQDIAELNRVLGVLDTEKSSRVTESSELRGQVRKFVQSQIDALKQFLVLGDLLDYIGGELVERSQVEDKSLLIVDLAHPVPNNGTLTGVGAYMTKPSTFQVKIFRPVDNDLMVIWESKAIRVMDSGNVHYDFPVTVGLEKGDFIGYYFPDNTGVSFDEGTSDTRYITKDISLGDSVKKSSLLGENKKRAYSIGVYGLLN